MYVSSQYSWPHMIVSSKSHHRKVKEKGRSGWNRGKNDKKLFEINIVVCFLDQYYHNKSMAIQIPHDAGLISTLAEPVLHPNRISTP
jgi:hypothetical protein